MNSLIRVNLLKLRVPLLWCTLLHEQVTLVPHPQPCGDGGVEELYKRLSWLLFWYNKLSMFLTQESCIFCHYMYVKLAGYFVNLRAG